jgi:cbb3-type cytochrome oxidase subunit 3
METMMGIEIFPMMALLIFFLFFVGLIIWVVRTKKEYITTHEQIPLNNDDYYSNI